MCSIESRQHCPRVLFGCQDGLYFIAYEFANGRTIKDLIQHYGRLTTADAVNYAIQVTLALNHIAAAGIVHRDIKPSNIILTDNGRVKVVDLGLARRETTDSIGDITVAGTTLGTFDYIAPEQARDPRSADIRSDIYSLGCTMYHMLTGQPPYPEELRCRSCWITRGNLPRIPGPSTVGITGTGGCDAKDDGQQSCSAISGPRFAFVGPDPPGSDDGLQSIPAEGIVWRKLDPVSTRQPMGAIWLFASVVVICVTAVFLRSIPEFGGSSATVADTGELPGIEFTPDSGEPLAESGTGTSTGAGKPAVDSTANSGKSTTVASSEKEQGVPLPVNSSGTESRSNGSVGTSTPGERILHPVPILSMGPIAPALMEVDLEPPRVSGETMVPAESSGAFILQAASGAGRPYRTLQGAVANARSGDVILLKFNGYPADIPAQPPIRITA